MQGGAERRELGTPELKRLNLGLAAFGLASMFTHVMHLDTLTPPAALFGCCPGAHLTCFGHILAS
jgi:hypothetical protein